MIRVVAPDGPWLRTGCVLAGLVVGGALFLAVPPSPADVDEARRIGLISATTIAGHDPGRDLLGYGAGMAAALVTSLGLWRMLTRGDPRPSPLVDVGRSRACSWREAGIVAAVLLPALLRFDLAVNGWDAHYTFFAEEGQALAWTEVVRDGGVLARDVYCLYGPLATAPFAVAFALADPSVWLFRVVLYLLDLPALVAIYVLLRGISRTRAAAIAGVILVALHRMWPMPGMSWSLLRVGLGLAALAAVSRAMRDGSRSSLVAAGGLLGLAVLFSQEAGTAAAVACCSALALRHGWRLPDRDFGKTALRLGAGFAATVAPVLVVFASDAALGSLVDNLFGFSRLRILGHGGLPLAGLSHREIVSLAFGPAVVVAGAFGAAVRVVARRCDAVAATEAGLAVYGGILFVSPLSRPDATHVLFAIPPALLLTVALLERAVDGARISRTRSAAAAAVAGAIAAAGGIASLDTLTTENASIVVRQIGLDLSGRSTGPAEDGMRALDLPRAGGVRVPADRAAEIEGVVGHLRQVTAPGEPVWCFPAEPMLNFLADRPLASRYPLGLFAVTREQRRELIAEVERRRVRYVVVNTRPIVVDGIPSRDALPELWSYVESRFEPERTFGRFAVMRRRPD